MPATLALIGQLFADDKQRTKAISLWATCQFGCAALGPVVGGVVLNHLWWGSACSPLSTLRPASRSGSSPSGSFSEPCSSAAGS
jgi:hypothetical protein